MAMTKNKTLAMIAFSSIFVLVGFQNCSKVGVMDTSSSSDKVAGNGLVAGGPDTTGNASDPNSDASPPIKAGPHISGQPTTPDEERAHLVSLCMKSKGGPLAGPRVEVSYGHVVIESDDIQLASLTAGTLLVKGKSDHSHGSIVKTTSAPIVICGMDVDEVETTSGDVTLVNCHIKKSLTMSHGVLTTYHSSVEGSFNGTASDTVSLDED